MILISIYLGEIWRVYWSIQVNIICCLQTPHTLHSLTPLRSGTTSPSMAMATSISALTSSLSSLSFSSQISHKPVQSLSISSPKPLSLRTSSSRFPALVVVAASSAVADPSVETADLKKLVKSRLPGGFAAQTIIGTGRRKCAIARVVLQEGSGRIIINYRDATVLHFPSLLAIDCFGVFFALSLNCWEFGLFSLRNLM